MTFTDASKNILGFKYQEMVALMECLNANDGTKVYLECFGDISDGDTSTEVKHSVDDDKTLIDTHIDFWKTLSNLLAEYDTYRFYNLFILHTTAKIKKGSIFDSWVDLSPQKKMDNVLSVKANQTIEKYIERVHAFDRDDLRKVLSKFNIKDDQQSAKEYYKNVLLKHPGITNIIQEKDRESFLCSLLGYMSSELIEAEDYVWSIDIDDFRTNFRSYANHYQLEDLKFPDANTHVKDDTLVEDGFRFVKELKRIKYEAKVGKAMLYYLKASDSQIQMINSRRSLIEALERYDQDLCDMICDLKDSHMDKLKEENEPDINQKSRRFFDESIDKAEGKTKIVGVTYTRGYYPKGRTHQMVEDNKNFTWKLDKEDESE